MTFWAGPALIVLTIAMILVARPKGDAPAPFLKVWIVGQIYALTAMVSSVMGVTIVITRWPF